MDIKKLNPSFMLSVAGFRDLPELSCSEFCVAGRSNVGKSSFISHVLSRKGLALSSKEPGKTRLANYFSITGQMVWVDLPGYGYARAPGTEHHRWAGLMEEYFKKRDNLSGVVMLVDVRHPDLEIDRGAFAWFTGLNIPVFIVITKCDKLGLSVLNKNETIVRRLYPDAAGFVKYSVNSMRSRDDFWKAFAPWSDAVSTETA
jgi:GTP-binding protein